uniref:Pyruvate kinase C-terminal domain-containing protein n=1 Tax=Tetranychus urticae TaxID=32264 RepID=T1KCP8_TETUR
MLQSSSKACFKSCLLRMPYGTVLATILALCGVAIILVSLLESAAIADRLIFELLHRKYLCGVHHFLCFPICNYTNQPDDWSTTGRNTSHYSGQPSCTFCGSATSCLVKCVFIANYVLFYLILALTIAFTVALFICYIMSGLCSEGRTYEEPNGSNHLPPSEVTDSSQQLNLKLFAPLLNIKPNETDYLLVFEGYKLKKLCVDYLPNLYLYIIFCFAGFLLLFSGFLNYLINLSINWARITTSQKCAELIDLDSAEMTHLAALDIDSKPPLVRQTGIICTIVHLWRGLLPICFTGDRAGDWPQDVDELIQAAIDFGKARDFMRTGDSVIVVTGFRKDTGSTNTMKILQSKRV